MHITMTTVAAGGVPDDTDRQTYMNSTLHCYKTWLKLHKLSVVIIINIIIYWTLSYIAVASLWYCITKKPNILSMLEASIFCINTLRRPSWGSLAPVRPRITPDLSCCQPHTCAPSAIWKSHLMPAYFIRSNFNHSNIWFQGNISRLSTNQIWEYLYIWRVWYENI